MMQYSVDTDTETTPVVYFSHVCHVDEESYPHGLQYGTVMTTDQERDGTSNKK